MPAHRPPAALSDGGGCGSCRLSWRRTKAATAPRTPPSFRGYFFLLAVWTRSGATYGERFEPLRIEPRKAEGELLCALACACPLGRGSNTRMASIRFTHGTSIVPHFRPGTFRVTAVAIPRIWGACGPRGVCAAIRALGRRGESRGPGVVRALVHAPARAGGACGCRARSRGAPSEPHA